MNPRKASGTICSLYIHMYIYIYTYIEQNEGRKAPFPSSIYVIMMDLSIYIHINLNLYLYLDADTTDRYESLTWAVAVHFYGVAGELELETAQPNGKDEHEPQEARRVHTKRVHMNVYMYIYVYV
jgi:hypothetical protein